MAISSSAPRHQLPHRVAGEDGRVDPKNVDYIGRVDPKNVDYMTQFPKGHALVPVDCSGLSEAGDVDIMCRVCHASAPVERACKRLVWLAAAQATPCVQLFATAFDGADASTVKNEDFPLEVRAARTRGAS
jgi:hypothetical protein